MKNSPLVFDELRKLGINGVIEMKEITSNKRNILIYS